MEVILATALLMGSVVVLSRLIGMGRTQANKAEFQSEAQRLCENTMHEIMLGLRPLESTEDAPLRPVSVAGFGGLEDSADGDMFTGAARQLSSEANPPWLYAVRIGPVPNSPELTGLTVEVSQAESTLTRPVRFQLSRWVRFDTRSGSDPAGGLFSEAGGFR
ncbi:MAG: hypothetical protein GY903_08445 [Fuerstiella sp.]|nr:hypothetical protein [Fuerstiella sp.]